MVAAASSYRNLGALAVREGGAASTGQQCSMACVCWHPCDAPQCERVGLHVQISLQVIGSCDTQGRGQSRAWLFCGSSAGPDSNWLAAHKATGDPTAEGVIDNRQRIARDHATLQEQGTANSFITCWPHDLLLLRIALAVCWIGTNSCEAAGGIPSHRRYGLVQQHHHAWGMRGPAHL